MAAQRDELQQQRNLERAIVLHLLEQPRSRLASGALARAIEEPDAAHVSQALQRLHEEGIIEVRSGLVSASRPTRALDDLNLLGI